MSNCTRPDCKQTRREMDNLLAQKELSADIEHLSERPSVDRSESFLRLESENKALLAELRAENAYLRLRRGPLADTMVDDFKRLRQLAIDKRTLEIDKSILQRLATKWYNELEDMKSQIDKGTTAGKITVLDLDRSVPQPRGQSPELRSSVGAAHDNIDPVEVRESVEPSVRCQARRGKEATSSVSVLRENPVGATNRRREHGSNMPIRAEHSLPGLFVTAEGGEDMPVRMSLQERLRYAPRVGSLYDGGKAQSMPSDMDIDDRETAADEYNIPEQRLHSIGSPHDNRDMQSHQVSSDPSRRSLSHRPNSTEEQYPPRPVRSHSWKLKVDHGAFGLGTTNIPQQFSFGTSNERIGVASRPTEISSRRSRIPVRRAGPVLIQKENIHGLGQGAPVLGSRRTNLRDRNSATPDRYASRQQQSIATASTSRPERPLRDSISASGPSVQPHSDVQRAVESTASNSIATVQPVSIPAQILQDVREMHTQHQGIQQNLLPHPIPPTVQGSVPFPDPVHIAVAGCVELNAASIVRGEQSTLLPQSVESLLQSRLIWADKRNKSTSWRTDPPLGVVICFEHRVGRKGICSLQGDEIDPYYACSGCSKRNDKVCAVLIGSDRLLVLPLRNSSHLPADEGFWKKL